ncbi:MAG: ABC transporter permease [Acidobacteria bacterium]|nr:ABC transporter permease [Acidobacteriota bacterium]
MDIWQDIRFAARLLVKDRWFTLAAATALALGIGANAAVFTFVNAVLVRGLPFHEPDRIMAVWTEDDRSRRLNTSELDYEDWRAEARSFSELAATLGSTINVSDEGRAPERVEGAYVTANLFRLIGQPPVIGRDFTDAAIERADCVVAVGFDMVEYHPSSWNRGEDKAIIHVDMSPAEVDRNYRTECEIVGDIGLSLDALTRATAGMPKV